MDYIKSYFLVSFILIIISYIAPGEEYRKYMKYFVGILMATLILNILMQIINFDVDYSYIEQFKVFEKEISNMDYVNGEAKWFENFLRTEIEKN